MSAPARTRGKSRRATPAWLRVKLGAPRRRFAVLLVAFVLVAVGLTGRCIWIQGLDPSGTAAAALKPQTQSLPATRGTITDRNGQVLAESDPAVNITADPTMVATNGMDEQYMDLADKLKAQAGPGLIAGILEAHLGGDYQTFYEALTTTQTKGGEAIRYAMLKRSVATYTDMQVTDKIASLGYAGLFREPAPTRSYPNGTVGSNIVGYMTYSDDLAQQGKYPWAGGGGLEFYLNESLTGLDGEEFYEQSPYGKIPTNNSVVKPPQEGISYTLTIDLALQYMQDQRLAAAVQANMARGGTAVTIDIRTGEILAMSDYHTFDPNDLSSANVDDLGNRAVTAAYEPGSVEKVLSMSIVVDQGLAAPDTHVIVPGRVASGDSVIGDSWGHDTIHLTGAGVIARSSNIGMILLTRQLDKATFVDYLHSFGLGAPTGIGLPGESAGYVPDASMSDQTRDNMAFGQGLSVTTLQEAAAIAAVANGGVYNPPVLIKAATTADGKPVPVAATPSHRVISPETSAMVLQMMEAVPEFNARTFAVDGYRVATKSGTAEAADPSCGCYNGFVVSYIGTAPAENPYLLTYVVIDHPGEPTSGTAAAAPVVQDVLSVALPRYAVPPSTTDSPHLPIEW